MIVQELLIQLGFDGGDADRKIGSLTKTLGGLVAGFGAGAMFAKLAREAGQAVDASRALSKQLGQIEALMPGQTAVVLGMRDSIQELAVTYGKSTAEIGQGLEGAVQSFNDAESSLAALNLAVKTASASGATTSDALQLLSAVTKAYGDTSAKTMKQVADLGQQTVLIGDVQMSELAGSIGRVTPMASQLGIKLEELFSVFAASTGPLGSASEVATQYSSVLRGIVDRSPAMQKAFKKAFGGEGIKTAQQAIGKHGLQGTLKALLKQTDGTTEGIQALFGRVEAVNLSLFLTGKGAETAARANRELAQSADSVDKAFTAQTTGLGKAAFAAQQAESRFQVLQEKAGAQLDKTFAGAKKTMFEFANLSAEVFVPSVDKIGDAFSAVVGPTEDWRSALEGLRDVLLSIAQVVDVAMYAAKAVGSVGAATAATFASPVDRALQGIDDAVKGRPINIKNPFGGVPGIWRSLDTDSEAASKGLAERLRSRNAMMGTTSRRSLDTPPRTSYGLEDLRNDASRISGSIGGFLGNRVGSATGATQLVANGAVTINVTVPAGTEASAASRIADVGAREFWQQTLKQFAAAQPSPFVPGGG